MTIRPGTCFVPRTTMNRWPGDLALALTGEHGDGTVECLLLDGSAFGVVRLHAVALMTCVQHEWLRMVGEEPHG